MPVMSPSVLSTQDAPAQRVSASRQLGVKSKSASHNQRGSPLSAAVQGTAVSVPKIGAQGDTKTGTKRKTTGTPALDQSAKKARTGLSALPTPRNPLPPKPKTVSFAAEPGKLSTSAETANKSQAPNKQKRRAAKHPAKGEAKKQSTVDLQPAIEYLRLWHTSRDQWKFNKNHQTKLVENVFATENTIPPLDINIFYEYIQGLKGYGRTRLRQSAAEVRKADMEQGAEAFPALTGEAAKKKQKEYEDVVSGFLRENRTPEKRRFEEVEYVLRTADMEMKRRVVKRMRAETILEDLPDDDSAAANAGTSSTKAAQETEGGPRDSLSKFGDGKAKETPKPKDDSQRERKRRRKMRTTEVEDEEDTSSSSSESESDSDSDSSSSDSSSEASNDDDEMDINQPAEVKSDTSSSSSSSSDSSSDDDSDDSENNGEENS